MSLKSSLDSKIKEMSRYIASMKIEIDGTSRMYTEAGKKTLYSKMQEEYQKTVCTVAEQAAQIIEQAKEKYLSEGKTDLSNRIADSGYQTALSNAVALIGNPYFSDYKVLQNIVDVFERDEFAISAIRCALMGNDKLKMYVQNLPANSNDKKDTLEILKKNLNKMKEFPYNGDFTSKEYLLKWMSAALEHLDDNLLYLE